MSETSEQIRLTVSLVTCEQFHNIVRGVTTQAAAVIVIPVSLHLLVIVVTVS